MHEPETPELEPRNPKAYTQNTKPEKPKYETEIRNQKPEPRTQVLKDWFASNQKWPYPTDHEQAELARRTGVDPKVLISNSKH